MSLKLVESKKQARREQFLKENYVKWNETGNYFREKRLHHGLSLREVGRLLGTSPSRIRKFEVGAPVSMAEHLKKSYTLLFDHLELHAALLDIRENHKLWRG